ncbi:SAP30-binding protein-like [Amphiura filiformis]|uniref:SAP30-binding protein-like n=1 Tax=Amphiura filiformis TaxID=82378 RepID=UPI003B21BBFF
MSLPRVDSSAAFSSLLSYAASDSDSDNEDKPMEEKPAAAAATTDMKPPSRFPNRLVSYPGDEGEDGQLDDSTEMEPDAELPEVKEELDGNSGEENSNSNMSTVQLVNSAYLDASVNSNLGSSFAESIKNKPSDEVTLPPEPKGRCSKQLQEKIIRCYRKYDNMNPKIQNNKEFRNPSIYEKLISYLSIDQLGTNYPKEMYDPHVWEESSYYEALSKAQKEDMAKREKEKKEKTKVEFVMGMAKKPLPVDQQLKQVASSSSAGASTAQILGEEPERKRKSKWGMQTNPQLLAATAAAAAVGAVPLVNRPQITIITTTVTHPTVISTTTSAAGNKTTVISSVGTLKKPKLDK